MQSFKEAVASTQHSKFVWCCSFIKAKFASKCLNINAIVNNRYFVLSIFHSEFWLSNFLLNWSPVGETFLSPLWLTKKKHLHFMAKNNNLKISCIRNCHCHWDLLKSHQTSSEIIIIRVSFYFLFAVQTLVWTFSKYCWCRVLAPVPLVSPPQCRALAPDLSVSQYSSVVLFTTCPITVGQPSLNITKLSSKWRWV